MPPCSFRWLDTARVVRRTWSQFARSGYGLAPVSSFLGIDFNHHDAAEDARAAGEILLHAMKETGLSIDEWMVRVTKPIDGSTDGRITREGDPEGLLNGEVAVFTGALEMSRHEAADLASRAGCCVDSGVTKKTTLLIVGDQDVKRLAPGHVKSNKHLKAENLIARGQQIRILRETDFNRLIASATK